jgi:Holliday junction resolvasome RuvABC endonuclease subunit
MITRTPVRRMALHFAPEGAVRILGVDTGLANVGLCVIDGSGDRYACAHAEVFRTAKASKKARRNLRVSTDDARRLGEIYDHVTDLIHRYRPHGIAVEAYTPNPGQRGVGAWKTAMAYALILAVGRAHKVAVFTYLPADIKKPFGGRLSASKEEVAANLVQHVEGFRALYAPIAKALKEHASDACAHGVLGVQEMISMRRLMGVS